MHILSVTAADPAQTAVLVATPDGEVRVPWPCTTWHREAIEAWLAEDDARAIAPFAPPPPDRAALRARAIAALDALSATVTSGYPAAEVASWPIKDREARAILAGGDPAATTVVGPLAAALGVPAGDVAAKIVAKADAYTGLMLWIEARRTALDAVLEGGTDAEVEAAVAALEAAVEVERAALAEG